MKRKDERLDFIALYDIESFNMLFSKKRFKLRAIAWNLA